MRPWGAVSLCCGHSEARESRCEGKASWRAEWSLKVNRSSLEGWEVEVRAGRSRGCPIRARECCFSPSSLHRCLGLGRALWMEAWTMHTRRQSPSRDLISRVEQGRAERQPGTSCRLGQMQAWRGLGKLAHSFIIKPLFLRFKKKS